MSDLAKQASALLRAQGKTIAFAESCTGGMLCAAITDLSGSSQIFDRGFMTYSNDSKIDMLNVSRETLYKHGAVSHECANEMATGAIKNSHATIAISTTGIAGPEGGTADKPVGRVYIALAHTDTNGAIQVQSTENNFTGSRQEIRNATCDQALTLLIEHLGSSS